MHGFRNGQTTPINSWLCDMHIHARDACMQIQVLKKLTNEVRTRKVVRKKTTK